MEATGRRHGLFWALVLVAAAVSVGLGASASRARAATTSPTFCFPPGTCPTTTTTTRPTDTTTTVPETTSTTAPAATTTTTVPPPSPYTATFVPCLTKGASGPCNQTPQQLEVGYQPGTTPPAVEVDWVANGRSAAAPNPASTSAVLAWSDGSPCGANQQCWPWPSALTDGAFVLNGTYQVAACGTYTSGTCQSTLQPSSVGLAVRPNPPASVSATSAGTEVTVQWVPPGDAPPDLAGYTLSRDGHDLYTCSTDDLGPGASVPCPQPLTVADHPGNGRFAYAVRSIRLGVDTASRNIVASAALDAAGGAVTVPGSTPGSGGVGTTGGSIPVTVAGGDGSNRGVNVSLSGPTTTVRGAPTATIPAGSQAGTTGSVGRVADPPDRSALRLKVPSHTDVVPVAVLALGILALAVAAHFLYMKVEGRVVVSRFISVLRRLE